MGGTVEHTAANGDGSGRGPRQRLRKALEKFYPEIAEIQLTTTRCASSTKRPARRAGACAHRPETTRLPLGYGRVSENIIEASWQALVAGIEYYLYKKKLTGDRKVVDG